MTDDRPDPEDVWAHYGRRIVGHRGTWSKCECPLLAHEDNNPSASVNIDTGKWQCFSCGQFGDVYDVIQANEGLDFREAREWAAKNFEGVTVDAHRKPSGSRPGRGNWSPPWSKL